MGYSVGMDGRSPRIAYDNPTLTLAVKDGRIQVTSTDGITGKYLSDFSLQPGEARRMGRALIDYADQLDAGI
jgi:hypothetical protein